MATVIWRGSARAIAQVNTFAFAGTWEADDLIRVIFTNGKRYDFTAGSTTTATVVSNLVTNWLALDSTDYPEFAEVTPSANSTTLTLTAATAGVPFVCTLTPLEANGGAADAQTIEGAGTATSGTAATASAGPNDWSTALNWSGGAVPVDNDDVVIEASDVDILYGLSQSSIDLTSLTVKANYTGRIGLPAYNEDGGYYEYRTQYLTLGTATTFKIGEGDGDGSPRLKVDTGSNACSLTVYKTGAGIDAGLPPLLWKGAHNSNLIEMQGGSIGIAVLASETATVATLLVTGDAQVWAGSGVTLTTLKQDGNGSSVLFEGTGTTLTLTGGELTVKGGNITTLTNDAGTVFYMGSGTITTYNGGHEGTLDCTKDLTSRTITNCNAYKETTVKDPFGTITFTNPIQAVRCRYEDLNLNTGYHRTIQFG